MAYASTLTFWPMAYGVAETDEDMISLISGTAAQIEEPLMLLVPLQSELFPWSLDAGLREVKPMNVMAMGNYQEPQGAWFPSVLY